VRKVVSYAARGLAILAVAAVAANASAKVTETVYGVNTGGGIDFNDPLFSFDLGGNINLANQTTTLLTYGDSTFGAWTLPSGSAFGADLSGDVTAPTSGWYTFDLSLNGNLVTVTASPGQGGTFNNGAQSGFSVFLPSGNSGFDFQYNNGGGHTGATLHVEGDDPGSVGGPTPQGDPVPDTGELVCLFPAALCAAHAARRFLKR